MSKFMSILAGSLVGGLASAVTVLLMTPKSGQAMRADIKREVDAIMEEGRRASELRRVELEAQLSQLRGDLPLSNLDTIHNPNP
jgi:gas vesicle protein